MKSQKEPSRTSVSKSEDREGTRRELLVWTMVAAVATVMIGSQLQMVAADERKFHSVQCDKGDVKREQSSD